MYVQNVTHNTVNSIFYFHQTSVFIAYQSLHSTKEMFELVEEKHIKIRIVSRTEP